MKTRYLVIGLVVVLAAVTGVLVWQGNKPTNTAQQTVVTVIEETTVAPSPDGSTPPASSGQPPASSTKPPVSSSKPPVSSAPPTSSSSGGQIESNVPMRKLKPGEKAPQFIIFSFDGVGSHAKIQEFMAAAQPHNARFVGFLTGLYLLTDDNANKYQGPRHQPGQSEVGFGGDAAEVATRINDLNLARSRGHEIGTHYNGHFCGPGRGGAGWTTADWTNDLTQFMGFIKNYKQNNPGVTLPELNLKPEDIKGGRTQCLDGQLPTLLPAWKKFNFSYDSSINAPYSGVNWPEKKDGIWEFYMPYVYSPGFGKMVINMDYNMWVRFNGGKNEPSTAPELREKVYQTYTYLYDQTYNGNRAPLLIANHFNDWNGNSFNPATLKFMQTYCGKPNTYCATYTDVIAWMELQDPAVLNSLLNQQAVAGSAP